MSDLLSARKRIAGMLARASFVQGVGVSENDEGEPCIVVYVAPGATREQRRRIPGKESGFPVDMRTLHEARCL